VPQLLGVGHGSRPDTRPAARTASSFRRLKKPLKPRAAPSHPRPSGTRRSSRPDRRSPALGHPCAGTAGRRPPAQENGPAGPISVVISPIPAARRRLLERSREARAAACWSPPRPSRRPWPPARWAVADARQYSDWHLCRKASQGCICTEAHWSIPTSRGLPPLPRRTRIAPRAGSRSLSASASASLMRSPARHGTTNSPRRRSPYVVRPAQPMTRLKDTAIVLRNARPPRLQDAHAEVASASCVGSGASGCCRRQQPK